MVDVYIDGGCRGNPGKGAFGFVVTENDKELSRYGKKLAKCTNNTAEYSALIGALEHLTASDPSGHRSTVIYSDSELLVNQVNGRYKVRSIRLLPFYKRADRLLSAFRDIKVVHIKREENRLADWIVNRVMDNRSYER